MDALHRQFSRRVRRLMQERKLSLNALADAAGVGRGRLSEILRGKVSPTLRTVGKLAKGLGVSTRQLFSARRDVKR